MTYQVRDKETDETLVECISHGNPEHWQIVALQARTHQLLSILAGLWSLQASSLCVAELNNMILCIPVILALLLKHVTW